ncbi:MAG: hypothetical protein EAZ89_06095 [Bacteroidetes bacterium]|nr:MAG: hypothetical protein EAZ89_06095 [Bacteroidota bacterium]
MSHEVKTERHVFFQNYDAKAAAGDVYVNTRVQVFREKKARPDLAFRAGIKTASGGTLGAARYTDAPGYYFDASAGKSLLPHDRFRIYAMIGLYVWQTYDPRYLQNDAILYGLGHSLWIKNWTFRQDLSGYWGYLGNGDRPLLYRFRLERRQGHLLAMLLGQAGLYDFPYKSLELALGVRL